MGVNPHIIYSYTSSSSTSTDSIKCGLCSIVTFYHWEISINNWAHQLPRWYSGKESTWQCRRWFDPWGGKIPWRRKWQPTPVLLPGKVHGQRRLAGYRPWGGKELKTTEHTFLLPTSKWTQAVQTHVVQGCSMNQSYEPRSAYKPRFLPPSSHASSSHTLKNNTLCMIYCFPNSSVTLLIY